MVLGTSAHRSAGAGVLLLSVAAFVSACTGGSVQDPTQPTPTAARALPPDASDLVPTIEELIELGVSGSQAECFVREIDPDGDGRVGSADDFGRAFATCFTASG